MPVVQESQLCVDERKCCLRDNLTGGCRALSSTYKRSGECPFCKANIMDMAERLVIPESQLNLKTPGEEYGLYTNR